METLILTGLIVFPLNGLLFVGAITKYQQAMRLLEDVKQRQLRLLARRR